MGNRQPAKSTAFSEQLMSRRSEHGHAHRSQRRPLRVLKFGGTSVGDAACIHRVVEIVQQNSRDSQLVVVVSAMSGVTNKLIEAARLAEAGDQPSSSRILQEIGEQHTAATQALISSADERDQIRRTIRELLELGESWCKSTAAAGRLSSSMSDLISSLGERLSTPLVAGALTAAGLLSEPVDASKLIVTDGCHGAADPRTDLTGERCELHLRPLLHRGIIPVVTGFIGSSPEGALTTLGRGGSDYSATIVGAALKADEVIIWTDVDGMLTADPHIVPGALTIPEISYREATELAYFGAKVLHPKTLRPVMQQGIPVWIRNTFSPLKMGTKITPAGDATNGDVKALTAVKDAALITISGPTANDAKDFLDRTLAATKAMRVDVLMASEMHNHIFLVVVAANVQPTLQVLHRELAPRLPQGVTDHVSVDSTVAMLTVVGEDLQAVKEIIERATDKLRGEEVRVLACGQGGSSECHFSFVVSRKDVQTALLRTHREFEPASLKLQKEGPGNGTPKHNFLSAVHSRREELAIDNLLNRSRSNRRSTAENLQSRETEILDEASFRAMIARERKRTERSRKAVLLMLLDVGHRLQRNSRLLGNVLSALSAAARDTDVIGWYKTNSTVGVMFTEIAADDPGAILGVMMQRVSETLRHKLTSEKLTQISISWHMFPENWDHEAAVGNPTLYPDIEHRNRLRRGALALKRMIDIVGSAVALLCLAPVYVVVAILVKLGSKGPVLFRQERLGQFGKPFTFLKFRSMYSGNDRTIHQEFMKQVIKGNYEGDSESSGDTVYKMINDPRITPIGRLLRRTSLDELPQFINVLRGDMSLVGPRPPIPYECQEYDIWHRRRVLEVKPGITGLWQIKGRSRVRFDDMVRLDLQYVRTWSLWLDFQILCKTPAAVLWGGDAF